MINRIINVGRQNLSFVSKRMKPISINMLVGFVLLNILLDKEEIRIYNIFIATVISCLTTIYTLATKISGWLYNFKKIW